MLVDVYNTSREKVGEIELKDEIFAAEVKPHLVHRAVVYYLALFRRGTACTKTRGEVSGGGRKPWRQKGTGRARHGSIRSPIWRGGGVVHGPKPRDFSLKMNKKERRGALISLLSDRAGEGKLTVLDSLSLGGVKTKEFVGIKEAFGWKKPLVVIEEWDEKVFLSVRNVPGAKVVSYRNVNAYDVANHEELVFTQSSVKNLEEVLGS